MEALKQVMTITKIPLKDKYQSYKRLWGLNIWGVECPECTFQGSNRLTASFGLVKDELYHKMKFYIRCRCCGLTTAAFADPKETIDHWDAYFVKKEDNILLKEDDDEDEINLDCKYISKANRSKHL